MIVGAAATPQVKMAEENLECAGVTKEGRLGESGSVHECATQVTRSLREEEHHFFYRYVVPSETLFVMGAPGEASQVDRCLFIADE